MSCPIYVGRLIVIDGASIIVNIFSLADTSKDVYFCKENLLKLKELTAAHPVFFHVNGLHETFVLAYDVLKKAVSIITDRGQISVNTALAGAPKVVVYPFQIESSQSDLAVPPPPRYTLCSPFAYSSPNCLGGLKLFQFEDFVNVKQELLDRQSFKIKGVGAFQIQLHEMEHAPLRNQPTIQAPTSIGPIGTNPFIGTLRNVARAIVTTPLKFPCPSECFILFFLCKFPYTCII
jgi:hypothetical protein